MSVFDIEGSNNTRLFFDGGVGVARYDKVKYPFLEKLVVKQLNFRWRPERIDIVRDQSDFKSLTDAEKHIFTSNLKRQIVLDSVQGRAPAAVLGPICSQPELENWLTEWTESETLHSRSYTHIIQNIYAKPGVVFDEITDIPEIVECIDSISKYYDDLADMNTRRAAFELGLINKSQYDEYEHKKALWLCLNAINALEGVRFYVSFACSWAFAEMKKMEGNAKIIKEICRDENLHLAGTQQLIKMLPKTDPDFVRIEAECADEVIKIWMLVIAQEKNWAVYLMKFGAMLGLNATVLGDYVEWIAHKRMVALGIKPPFKAAHNNPLSWTEKWIAGRDVQVAPQEVAVDAYLESAVTNDTKAGQFASFEL